VNLQLLKARQTKYVGYATLYILVVVSIVSTVNVLANRYDKTYDATSNKRYSLSQQTAKIVKGLKEDAKITYFDQGTRFERAKDQLDLYAKLSRRVHVDFVDVDKKPQLAREAGIKSYGTTMVQIGAKREEAKGTSEEDITGALIRALKNNARTVCFVSGSGEHQIDDTDRSGYSRLRDLLVVTEIAVATLLLVGAGLATRSYRRLEAADPGFAAGSLLTAELTLSGERYPPAVRRSLSRALEARLARLAGVQAVGTTSFAPWSGERPDPPFVVTWHPAGYPAGGAPRSVAAGNPAVVTVTHDVERIERFDGRLRLAFGRPEGRKIVFAYKALRGTMHRFCIERARHAPSAAGRKREIRAPVDDPIEIVTFNGGCPRVEIIRYFFGRQDGNGVRTQMRIQRIAHGVGIPFFG